MNKHTPGPWLREGCTVYALNDDGFNRFCAQTQDAHTGKDELEANAQLMCVAPDLLEALEGLFADYKALADSGDAGNWALEDITAGKKAMAAIARARGEKNE